MKFYLVLFQSNFDDLPVRLFTDYQASVAFSKILDVEAAQGRLAALGIQTSDPAYVTVVHFDEGIPVRYEQIRDIQLEDSNVPGTSTIEFGFGRPLPEARIETAPLPGATQADPRETLPATPRTPNELLNSVYVDDSNSGRLILNGVPFNMETVRSYITVLNAMAETQKRNQAPRPQIKSVASTGTCVGEYY